jgi:hypothetical protein
MSLQLAWLGGAEEILGPLGVTDDLALALPGVAPGLDELPHLRETYRRLEPLAWRTKVRLDVDGDQADELRADIRLHGWKRFTEGDDGPARDVALEVGARDPRGNLLKLRVAIERRTAVGGVLTLRAPADVERWAALLGGLYAPLFDGFPLLLAAPVAPDE